MGRIISDISPRLVFKTKHVTFGTKRKWKLTPTESLQLLCDAI